MHKCTRAHELRSLNRLQNIECERVGVWMEDAPERECHGNGYYDVNALCGSDSARGNV